MSDNKQTVSSGGGQLPNSLRVLTLEGSFSSDTDANLAGVVLMDSAGAEGSRVFTLVRLPTALISGGFPVYLTGDAGQASVLETDDGTIAGAQANIAATLGLQYTWNGTAWVRGGWTPHQLISAASTNPTSLKAAAGVIGYISALNLHASAARFLKLYNKASAPTVGTDTPIATFLIPSAGTASLGGGTNIPIPKNGIAFSTGIAYAITTGLAVADTGAVGAAECAINIGWL